MIGKLVHALASNSTLRKNLQKHFQGVPPQQIVTAARQFPITSRVDVQTALDQMFRERDGSELFGIHSEMQYETPTFGHLLAEPLYEFHTHVIPRTALLVFLLVMPAAEDRYGLDGWRAARAGTPLA